MPAVAFELPRIDNAADLVAAASALTAATAAGTLAPSEAGDLARVLETARRMIDVRTEQQARATETEAPPAPANS